VLAKSIGPDLELCLLEARHAEPFFAMQMRDKEHFGKWIPYKFDENYTVESARNFIKEELDKFANNKGIELGIWHNRELIGDIGINYIDWPNKTADMGFSLASAFQGRGIATAACKALLVYAFDELQLHRMEMRCCKDNERACALARRLGFTQEGHRPKALWLRDSFWDQLLFGLIAENWTKHVR
jgi:ribosomal-protein-serine acetyltransferase